MKTFKDFSKFEKELEKGLCWEDKIKVGGRIYSLYEYGGGSLMHLDFDYVYFLNRRTKTLIYIKYDCPSYNYVNGVRVKLKDYRFISFDVTEGADLWR